MNSTLFITQQQKIELFKFIVMNRLNAPKLILMINKNYKM